MHRHKARKLHHHRTRRGERDYTPDSSTCIAEALYTPRAKVLTVTFARDGSVYQFSGVSRSEAKDVRDGGGVAFNAEILGDD